MMGDRTFGVRSLYAQRIAGPAVDGSTACAMQQAGCSGVSHNSLLSQCETLLPALYTRVVIPIAVWHAVQDPDTLPTVRV